MNHEMRVIQIIRIGTHVHAVLIFYNNCCKKRREYIPNTISVYNKNNNVNVYTFFLFTPD